MIHLLPAHVSSHLRSGVAITSVAQCVEELVLNSLDAGASCIAVRLDLSCFKIQVVDNGSGIPYDQLGVLASRHYTSKCKELEDLNNLEYFGFRGEALASIADIAALLDIVTRIKKSSKTYCKLFNKGSAHSVLESKLSRPSSGTTVTVHDLFHKLPVRKKTTNMSLELERVKQRLEGIALMHPSASISLRNDETSHKILQTRQSSSTICVFRHLFGSFRCTAKLIELSCTKGHLKASGFIAGEGHVNKNLQFVYINSRVVLKTKIHKVLNSALQKCFSSRRRAVSAAVSGSSPTKQIDRHGVFLVNITCPFNEYDITFDPAKTLVEFKDWDAVLAAVEELLADFQKHLSPTVSNTEGVVDPADGKDLGDPSPSALNMTGPVEISTTSTGRSLHSKLVRRSVIKKLDNVVEENPSTSVSNMQETTQMTVDEDLIQLENDPEKRTASTNNTCGLSTEPNLHELFNDQKAVDSMISVVKQTASALLSSDTLSESDTAQDTDNGCSEDPLFKTPKSSISADKSDIVVEENDSGIDIGNETEYLTTGTGSLYNHGSRKPVVLDARLPGLLTRRQKTSLAVLRTGHNSSQQGESSNDRVKSKLQDLRKSLGIPEGDIGEESSSDNVNTPVLSSLQKLKKAVLMVQSPVTSIQGEPQPLFGVRGDNSIPGATRPVISKKRTSEMRQSTASKLARLACLKPNITKTHTAPNKSRLNSIETDLSAEQLLKNVVSVRKRSNPAFCSTLGRFDQSLVIPVKPVSDVTSHPTDQDPVQSCTRTSLDQRHVHKTKTNYNFVTTESLIMPFNQNIHKSHTLQQAKEDGCKLAGLSLNAISNNHAVQQATESEKQTEQIPKPILQNPEEYKTMRKPSANELETDSSVFAEGLQDTKDQTVKTTSNDIRNEPLECLSQEGGIRLSPTDQKPLMASNIFRCYIASGQGVNSTESITLQKSVPKLGSENRIGIVGSGPVAVNESSPPIVQNIAPSQGFDFRTMKPLCYQTEDSADVNVWTPTSFTDEPVCCTAISKTDNFSSSEIRESSKLNVCSATQDTEETIGDETSSKQDMDVTPGASDEGKMLSESATIKSNEIKENQSMIVQSESNQWDTEFKADEDPPGRDLIDMLITPSPPQVLHQSSKACINQPGFFDSSLHSLSLPVDDSVQCRSLCPEASIVEDITANRLPSSLLIEEHVTSPKLECSHESISCGSLLSSSLQTSVPSHVANTRVQRHIPDAKHIQDDSQSVVLNAAEFSTQNSLSDQDLVRIARAAETDVAQTTLSQTTDSEQSMRSSVRDGINTVETSEEGVKNGSYSNILQINPLQVEEERSEKETTTSVQAESGELTKTVEGKKERPRSHPVVTCQYEPLSGKAIFIHPLTGNTLDEAAWDKWRKEHTLVRKGGIHGTKRKNLLSHDLAYELSKDDSKTRRITNTTTSSEAGQLGMLWENHVTDQSTADRVKWRRPFAPIDREVDPVSTDGVKDLFEDWDNPVFSIPEPGVCSAEIPGRQTTAVKVQKAVDPCRLTRTMIAQAQVLGQVDDKFIACLMKADDKNLSSGGNLLVLVDQHAAHERVRLEQLTHDAFESCHSGERKRLKRSTVDPPRELTLNEDTVRVMVAYHTQFNNNGLEFSTLERRDTVLVKSAPSCFVEREANEIKRGRSSIVMEMLQTFVKEQVELLKTTHGALPELPPAVHKLLCSQACHGAIKFGDPLTKEDCQDLVESLSLCYLPFQCAHGRPSAMPLLNLDTFRAKIPQKISGKPKLWKLRQRIEERELSRDEKEDQD